MQLAWRAGAKSGGVRWRDGEKRENPYPLPFCLPPNPLPLSTLATQAMYNDYVYFLLI